MAIQLRRVVTDWHLRDVDVARALHLAAASELHLTGLARQLMQRRLLSLGLATTCTVCIFNDTIRVNIFPWQIDSTYQSLSSSEHSSTGRVKHQRWHWRCPPRALGLLPRILSMYHHLLYRAANSRISFSWRS